MIIFRTFPAILFMTTAVFFTGLSVCFGADPTTGGTNPEYAIEIVVFQYLNPDDGGETGISLAEDSDFAGVRPLATIPELVPLAPDELKLGGEAYTFRRGANYRLLLHEGWHQKLTDRTNAEPVYVRYPEATESKTLVTVPGLSFTQHEEDAPMLEGIIQVALERYLHLTVDLIYRTDPSAPVASYQSDVYLDPDAPAEDIAASSPIYRLKETRRMRSGETHYLDHPQIGVIALIRKYDAPAAEAPAGTGPEDGSPTATNDPAP